jgi:hypothetical protein
MNCFEHPQKPAVGTCTHCGRGLCKECATVVEGLLSCRGDNCHKEITRKRELMAKQERAADERTVVYGTAGKMHQQAFASAALFGLLFVIGGALLLFDEEYLPGGVLLGLGLMLAIRSSGYARAAKKYKSLADERSESQPVNK